MSCKRYHDFNVSNIYYTSSAISKGQATETLHQSFLMSYDHAKWRRFMSYDVKANFRGDLMSYDYWG